MRKPKFSRRQSATDKWARRGPDDSFNVTTGR